MAFEPYRGIVQSETEEERLARLKQQIGFSDEPVQNADGYWTIGYGHRLGDQPGGPQPQTTWSEQFASDELRSRVPAGAPATSGMETITITAPPGSGRSTPSTSMPVLPGRGIGTLNESMRLANPIQRLQANPTNVNDFFDAQRDRIAQLAREMNVPENLLLGLAAYESGWGKKTNLFGLSVDEKPNQYQSFDDGITAFRNSQWFNRLSNKSDIDSFMGELLSTENGKHKFNSVNGKYDQTLRGVIGTVDRRRPIWERGRGQ